MPVIKLTARDAKPMLKAIGYHYRGRTFKLELTDKYFMDSSAEGGTFAKLFAVVQGDNGIESFDLKGLSPYDRANHGWKVIPVNVLIMAHEYFCGKDCGIRFYMHPESTFRSAQLEGGK